MISVPKDQDTLALEEIARALESPLNEWFDKEIVWNVMPYNYRKGGSNKGPELTMGYHTLGESAIEHIIKGKRVRVPSAICGIDIRPGKNGERAIYVQAADSRYDEVLVPILREYSAKNGFGELLTR